MTNVGTCGLCREERELHRSHILPNAVFRRIKKENSGKLIALKDDQNGPIHYTQESWWERLLCGECEGRIRNYETYGFQLLRGAKNVRAVRHTHGLTFQDHDFKQFKLFLTSLIWRAGVSKQPQFSKVVIPPALMEDARQSLMESIPLGPLKLGCKMARLNDSKPESSGSFSLETLKQLVISPMPRLYGKSRHYAFVMTFEGFLFEFFVPAVPSKRRAERGMHAKSKTLYVPYLDVYDVEEIFGLMVHAYGKYDRGLVAFEI